MAACVTQTAPETWRAPHPGALHGCPDLSGTYRNAGTDAEGASTTPLARMLFPEASANWTGEDVARARAYGAVTHVTITGPNASGLRIEAWRREERLGVIERDASLGDGYRCDEEGLEVALPVYATADMGVFFDGFRTGRFTPARDGALQAAYSSTSMGLAFYLIPIAMRFESVALYPRVNP